MPQQPTAIDQVFRHWDPMWQSRPGQLTKSLPIAVDVENVARYSEMMTYEKKKIPRIGRCFSPWDKCMLFWHEPTTDAGIAYKACIVAQARHEDGGATIHGLVLQRESMGAPVTILSGAFLVEIPAGGLLADDSETGQQVMLLDRFGDHGLNHQNYDFIKGLASTIASPLHVEAMHFAAQSRESWRTDTQKDMQIALCAFSFANCKNVKVVENGFTEPPPRWQKEGSPRVRHSVVKISAFGTTRTKGPHGESDIHMGLHICRGHFKTFSEEKPLLGKHVGTYWWADNLRGDAKYGVVEKSYKVET